VFARPEREAEWNAWYGGNLKVLLSVPGFRTGQRFKALEGSPPRYMAVYTVDSPDVFESDVYIKAGGGGTNSVRFRPAYQVWIRNLLEGIAEAPNVRDSECLIMVDSASGRDEVPGVSLTWLETVGFHKSTPYRGFGVVARARAAALREHGNVALYETITAQLRQLY
jgi:hypothetical protein